MFFNTPAEKESEEFRPIPVGDYRLLVEGSAYKATKTGTGHFMEVRMSVIDGPFKGRKVFDRFNIQNANPQAEQIGKGQMKRFLSAIGVTEPLASETDFHRKAENKIVIGNVVIEDGPKGPQNKVKGYVVTNPKKNQNSTPVESSSDLEDIPF